MNEKEALSTLKESGLKIIKEYNMNKYQAFRILKESGHKLIKEARETIANIVERNYKEVETLAAEYAKLVQNYFHEANISKYNYKSRIYNERHLKSRKPYAYISAEAYAYFAVNPAVEGRFYYYTRQNRSESKFEIVGYDKRFDILGSISLNWRDYSSAEELFEDTKEFIEKVTNYWINFSEEEKEKQDRIHHVRESEYPETEDIDEILSVKDGGTGTWTIKKKFSPRPASVKFKNYAQAIAALYFSGGYRPFEIEDSDQYLEDAIRDIKENGVDKAIGDVAYRSEDRGQRMYDYIIDPDGNKWWSIWTRH